MKRDYVNVMHIHVSFFGKSGVTEHRTQPARVQKPINTCTFSKLNNIQCKQLMRLADACRKTFSLRRPRFVFKKTVRTVVFLFKLLNRNRKVSIYNNSCFLDTCTLVVNWMDAFRK